MARQGAECCYMRAMNGQRRIGELRHHLNEIAKNHRVALRT